jgi:hypothetical protein
MECRCPTHRRSPWLQPLNAGKRRALLEQRDTARPAELDKHRIELRFHVLSLRESELDSRLSYRDRTIEELNLRPRELTGLLNKDQATRESLMRQLARPAPSSSGRAIRFRAASASCYAHLFRCARPGLLSGRSPAFGSPCPRPTRPGQTRQTRDSDSPSGLEDASPPLRYPYSKPDCQRGRQKPEHHLGRRKGRLLDAPDASESQQASLTTNVRGAPAKMRVSFS